MLSHQSCWNVFSSNAHFKPLKRPWFCYCRYCHLIQFSCSIMPDSLQPHGLQDARLSCLSNSWSLLKLMSIESVMPSNRLILCHPLVLLPSIFSTIKVFSSESVLRIMWPKYWSFSFSISPSNEYSGLISFRIDWFDLLAYFPEQASHCE